jgi:hypothetical protein
MTPASTANVSPQKAPFLQWLVAVPLLYLLLTLSALFVANTLVAGLRASGRPVSERLVRIREDESALVATIPTGHPVRLAASAIEYSARRIASYAVAIQAMASAAYIADLGNASFIVVRRGAMAFGLLAPMLIVFAAALQDGLAQRELRKYGGDPESSFVYHTAKGSVGTSIGVLVAAYLLCPTALHPHVVLCLLSPICALGVAITVTKFKKYL